MHPRRVVYGSRASATESYAASVRVLRAHLRSRKPLDLGALFKPEVKAPHWACTVKAVIDKLWEAPPIGRGDKALPPALLFATAKKPGKGCDKTAAPPTLCILTVARGEGDGRGELRLYRTGLEQAWRCLTVGAVSWQERPVGRRMLSLSLKGENRRGPLDRTVGAAAVFHGFDRGRLLRLKTLTTHENSESKRHEERNRSTWRWVLRGSPPRSLLLVTKVQHLVWPFKKGNTKTRARCHRTSTLFQFVSGGAALDVVPKGLRRRWLAQLRRRRLAPADRYSRNLARCRRLAP